MVGGLWLDRRQVSYHPAHHPLNVDEPQPGQKNPMGSFGHNRQASPRFHSHPTTQPKGQWFSSRRSGCTHHPTFQSSMSAKRYVHTTPC